MDDDQGRGRRGQARAAEDGPLKRPCPKLIHDLKADRYVQPALLDETLDERRRNDWDVFQFAPRGRKLVTANTDICSLIYSSLIRHVARDGISGAYVRIL